VTPRGRILVDGGGSYDSAYDFGRLRLLPKLADQAAVSFDAVVLTHPHPDHSRGLVAVVGLMPVKALYVSRGAPRNEFLDELLETARRRGVPIRRTGAGERIDAAGLVLDVLHPGPDPYPRAVENNSSLVLRLALGSRNVLLTGDIERLAEGDLVASGKELSSDLLKVCHHGSRTSTTAAFLRAVSPRVGVIGVGRHNTFGHPNPQVLERLRDARVRVFRTDLDGDVAIRFEEGRMLPLFPSAVAGSRG
jgi:competence protein ComEC